MRNIICILFAVFNALALRAQEVVTDFDKLDDCDLLFHVPAIANNITDVTSANDRIAADHVAIFVRIEGEPLIIDATSRGVAIRRVDSLFSDKCKVIMVRVKNVDKHATIKNTLSFLGRPYDYKFYADDNEIYCSELVQKCFVDNNGKKLFKTIPMSFHDETGKVTKYWKDYYRKRWNISVPEGEEGTNPADIYLQAIKL